MSLTIKNEGSICLESKQTIILDPKEKVAFTTGDVYLFTHLSTDLLRILAGHGVSKWWWFEWSGQFITWTWRQSAWLYGAIYYTWGT